jgi:hypothetical protein
MMHRMNTVRMNHITPDRRQSDDTNNTSDSKDRCESHIPQNFGELGMCERKRPETEVRRGVRDASKAELDGMDHLVDHNLAEIVMLLSSKRDQQIAR